MYFICNGKQIYGYIIRYNSIFIIDIKDNWWYVKESIGWHWFLWVYFRI